LLRKYDIVFDISNSRIGFIGKAQTTTQQDIQPVAYNLEPESSYVAIIIVTILLSILLVAIILRIWYIKYQLSNAEQKKNKYQNDHDSEDVNISKVGLVGNSEDRP